MSDGEVILSSAHIRTLRGVYAAVEGRGQTRFSLHVLRAAYTPGRTVARARSGSVYMYCAPHIRLSVGYKVKLRKLTRRLTQIKVHTLRYRAQFKRTAAGRSGGRCGIMPADDGAEPVLPDFVLAELQCCEFGTQRFSDDLNTLHCGST